MEGRGEGDKQNRLFYSFLFPQGGVEYRGFFLRERKAKEGTDQGAMTFKGVQGGGYVLQG